MLQAAIIAACVLATNNVDIRLKEEKEEKRMI